MLQKINKALFVGSGPIRILYPGRVNSVTDTGIGSIGRIDHPEIHGNPVIKLHPHINDEILSYFRTGEAEHTDSEGYVRMIGKNTLMLMKAGKLFYHEEKIFGDEEPMEGLQIFIRPGKKDLQPSVTFLELDSLHSENAWRLLASPTSETTFQFSSQTWLYDMKLLKNSNVQLPALPKDNLTCILYVFKGQVQVNSDVILEKKEGIVIKGENIELASKAEEAELVLFVTDESAEFFAGGMYSGNQA
ncbi:pirin family protein [Chitinophaga niabensis]|uniref:pirin family protein n=1 Tax=Chitinophaga niabensis TaxID=536979 RepID=UPI0031B9F42C